MNSAKYFDRIDGRQIVAGKIRTIKATGQRVRFHGRRAWGKIEWTADLGDTWAASLGKALETATTLDIA